MGSYKVLVIDDDRDILKILKENLEMDGYEVFTAVLGKESFKLFEGERIDLIILDLMLPDMDGVQICRTIRAKSQVPIIMLTARDGLTDKVLGLESGADDYIVKPFDYLEMAARVKACLRRGVSPFTPQEQEVVKADKLLINPNNRNVELKGKSIDFTKKEFDLLLLLVKNAGRVMDRASIKKELWPDEKLYEWSRTIDVHIQHLRAKLEEFPDQPRYIMTVPGIGYMFSATVHRKDAKNAASGQ